MGHAGLFLFVIHGDQDAPCRAGRFRRGHGGFDQTLAAPGLRVRSVHVFVLDCSLFAGGREMAALHTVADAVRLYIGSCGRSCAGKICHQPAGGSKRAEIITAAAVMIIFVVQPAWIAYKAAPHFALYTNALAADKVGYYFPHDEFYDDGLREAIQFVCEKAPQGAIIAHETPAATRYYLERFGRSDLNSQVISMPEFQVGNVSGPAYIIVQRGRTYFENREEIALLRSTFKKLYEVRVNGIVVAEVFANQN